MIDIVKDVNNIKYLKVVNLTGKFLNKDGYPGCYLEKNIKTYTFKNTVLLDKMFSNGEGMLPLNEPVLAEIGKYYNNVEFANSDWPTNLQILNHYGNHEGAIRNLYVHENLILIGNLAGTESLGWFDNYLVVVVRFLDTLFLYKIMQYNKIIIANIRQDKPFNSCFYINPEDKLNPKGHISFWAQINYFNYEHDEIDTTFENFDISDIYNPAFMLYSLSNMNMGYSDLYDEGPKNPLEEYLYEQQ